MWRMNDGKILATVTVALPMKAWALNQYPSSAAESDFLAAVHLIRW
jgi:hypothetical protein